MKIIHCSDMHLDSALGRHYCTEGAKERNAELCATFGRLVRFAVQESVDAVLIAGDLFDAACVSPKVADFVLEQIRSADSVTFFYIRGNHDESRTHFAGKMCPKNLKTFGECWKSYRCGDVVITAVEPEANGWYTMYDQLKLNKADLNIVMLHGQISARPGVEQIALPLLRGKGIRYLALGHLHSYRIGALDLDGEYCYCGCPEGRGFDECGEKGFVLVETECGRLSSRFVPFAARKLHEIGVDITAADTVTQMLARMEQLSADIPPADLVKFTLQGTYTLQTPKDLVFLQKMLTGKFHLVKISDESHLEIARENYEFDASLKGEFIRMVLASERSAQEKEKIITCGIRALSGEEVIL